MEAQRLASDGRKGAGDGKGQGQKQAPRDGTSGGPAEPQGEESDEGVAALFIPSPVITGISVNGGPIAEAASGKVGDAVTVTGLNLKNPTTVKFGAAAVTPTTKTDTQITFTVPEGASAGTVTITVATAGGDVSTDKFTVSAP